VKAAVYYENGGPEVLKYEDVPDPACPDDGVVIDVEVISLEGGDTLHRARTPLPTKPYIVGYQCAGTVREVGPRVTDRKVGDRVVVVVANGSHASRVAAPASTTWSVPAGADLASIATVPVAFGTAHEALFSLARAQPGERVLVHAGGSGVGLAAIQLARRAGAEVITTASSPQKLARLRELGAAHGVDYKAGDLVELVSAAVGRNAIDVVIDGVGGKTLEDSVTTLRYHGRIVNFGFAGRDLSPFNPFPLWAKNGALFGFRLSASLANEHEHTYRVIADCIDRVARGELRAVIDRTFPLSEAAAAHAYVEGRSAFGRVLLVP
jgi:NADPH2:quinone reductase